MSEETDLPFDKEKLKKLYGCKDILGPYIGKDGRKRCVIYYEKGNTPSKAFARVLIENLLNRLLSDDEHVDHINNDRTDDRIENLQILTKEQNRLKQAWWETAMKYQWTIIPCSYCHSLFYITENKLKERLKFTNDICCSRSCSSKYNASNQYGNHGLRFK